MKPVSTSPAARSTRTALLYSASIAALLCAATLQPGRATAACTAVAGTVTVVANETCGRIIFGSADVPMGSNITVEQHGTVTSASLATINATAAGAVGNLDIQGTLSNSDVQANVIIFTANITSVGNITVGENASVSGAAKAYSFEFLEVSRVGGVNASGTIDVENSGWRFGTTSGNADHNSVKIDGSIILSANVTSGNNASGNRYLQVLRATVNGDVTNSKSITLAAGAQAGQGLTPIALTGAKITGSVENQSTGVLGSSSARIGNGILIEGAAPLQSEIGGSVKNDGVIWGNFAGLSLSNAKITEGIANTNLINVNQNGILLTTAGSARSVTNSGTINSTGNSTNTAFSGISVSGAWEIAEGISNQGTTAQITVNNALSHGISVSGAKIGNQILNEGTIKARIHGINLENVSAGENVLVAALKNTGMITTSSNASTPLSAGIYATNSKLTSISNEGAAGKIEKATTGISLLGTIVTGAVSNDATIDAAQTGINIAATSDVGSVQNKANGKITVTAADADGISIANSNIHTEVSNAGEIKAIRYGITLDTVTGAAAVSNSKLITSSGAPLTAGIYANNSTVASISNTGAAASISNVVDALKAENTTVTNGIGNSGTLTATNDGIFVSGGAVGGESLNSGTITAVRHGINFDGVSSTGALTTALKNTGTITSTGTLTAGIFATSSKFASVSNGAGGTITNTLDGISLAGGSVTGAVSNAGSVTATQHGIGLTGTDAASAGALTNSGSITAATAGLLANAKWTINGNVENLSGGSLLGTGDGISLTGSTVTGAISNAGTIDVGGTGMKLESLAGPIAALSYGGAIKAGVDGVHIKDTSVTGDISNVAGTEITAGGHGISLTGTGTAASFVNYGTITAKTAAMNAEAGWTITGDVANYSSNSLLGDGDGIRLTGTTVEGNLNNTGRIAVGGNGVSLTGTTLKGRISNTGTVTAGATGFALADAGAISAFDNFGTITGGTTGISATGSTRIGTLTNAQGVGNAAGGLAYSGTLPTSYHIVIDGSSYGQLFVAPENHSGVMTFAISPLSNGVAPRTYSTVLTGINPGDLTNPGGVVYTFDVGNLYLRQQAGSETIWDLVMEYFYTYPDIPETLETADDTRKATDTVFAERRAVLSAAMQYDCDRFDVRGFCVELAGRVTDDEGELTGAAVVNAAVRLAEDFRLGAFIDQQLTGTDATVDHATARLRQSYDMPLLGAYLGYKQNEDGTGLQARIASGYQSGRLEIRRGGTDVSEAGEDETDLTAWYGFGTLGYGMGLGNGLLLTPYAGLQYTDVTRDGYGEEATAETLNPLRYEGYHERALTFQAGVEFSGMFNEETGFEAALGLEYDLSRSANDFSGTSPIPGLETFSLDHADDDAGNLRPAGMLSLFHDVAPNRRISATVFAGQDGFSEGFQGTALLAFRASF